MHRKILFLTTLFWTAAALASPAAPTLTNLFSDHMVLQRNQVNPVWGTSAANSEVVALLDGKPVGKVTTDAQGTFSIPLPAHPAGGPHVVTLKGVDGETAINDVYFGEVWLCSGQSNMQWSIRQSGNANEEIANANHPLIRHIGVPRRPHNHPQSDQDARWEVCSPAVAANWSAVAYYFGRHLHKELAGIPIGLIHSSWGGSKIEPWIAEADFPADHPHAQAALKTVREGIPGKPGYEKLADDYVARVDGWLAQAKTARSQPTPDLVTAPPVWPESLKPLAQRKGPNQQPIVLYNGMIEPLVPFGIRGALWYQGESNHTQAEAYVHMKHWLVEGWRKRFRKDFPFYFVQIAPFKYGNEDPNILPAFWEAQQQAAREIKDCEAVVIHDVGNISDIHPANKQEVGRRLALIALARDYGKSDVVWEGPRFDSWKETSPGVATVHFSQAEGLKTNDGKPPRHWEVLVAGKGLVPATATITGNTLQLSHAGSDPILGIRFGWHKTANPNLVNGAGLPAIPFRSSEVKNYDPLKIDIPESNAFREVLDLDLHKLSHTPVYALDERKTVAHGSFDRVAFLLELGSATQRDYAWVSFPPWSDDPMQLGIPGFGSKIQVQQTIGGATIVSSKADVPSGSDLSIALEFWSHNYGPQNAQQTPGASDASYDWGDTLVADAPHGYGSLQIHVPARKTTVLAVNRFKDAGQADVGIGNAPGQHSDWTFSGSAKNHAHKRLRVFVRPKG